MDGVEIICMWICISILGIVIIADAIWQMRKERSDE